MILKTEPKVLLIVGKFLLHSFFSPVTDSKNIVLYNEKSGYE